ncbi:MAG: hypothetical protein KDI98_02710 [Hyphomicrobiaceae bacterium]|nr:hypothetical protein [Hyphomicrobiaceae bacterium]
MAAEEEEEENYWPGYVDALSTMTMVLVFVMMILVVVVFQLIQNTTKAVLEEIVSETNIGGANANTSVQELSQVIVEALTTARNRGTPPIVTVDETSPQETNVQAVAVDEETERLSETGADVRDPGTQEAVTISQEELTVTFQPRATRLDDETQAAVADFAQNSELVRSGRTLEVIAFADTTTGNVTDARRTAYYRAMLLRNALLAGGVEASRISVGVRDSVDAEEGRKVRVYGR